MNDNSFSSVVQNYVNVFMQPVYMDKVHDFQRAAGKLMRFVTCVKFISLNQLKQS